MKYPYLFLILLLGLMAFSQVPENYSGIPELRGLEEDYYEAIAAGERPPTVLAEHWLSFEGKLKDHPHQQAFLKQKLQDLLETDFHYYANFIMKIPVEASKLNEYIKSFLVDNQQEMGKYVLQYYFGAHNGVGIPQKGEGWSAFKRRMYQGVGNNSEQKTGNTTTQEVYPFSTYIYPQKIKILLPGQKLEPSEKAYCYYGSIFTHNNSTNGQDVSIEGYYKGKESPLPSGGVRLDGLFTLPRSLFDHRFSGEQLYHIGIICSHRYLPTQSWLDSNNVDHCYTITHSYSKQGDGIVFRYTDAKGNNVVVTVTPKRYTNEGRPVQVTVVVNE